MVGVEPDVDRGHPGVVGRSLGALAGGLLLLEQVRVPPVAERDLRVRRRGHGLTENGEVGDRGVRERGRALAALEGGGSPGDDRVCRDLASEQGHLRQVGARVDGRSVAAHRRAAGRSWPPAGSSRRPGRRTRRRSSRPRRRGVLAREHRDLARDLDLDAVLGGARRRLRRGPARTGQSSRRPPRRRRSAGRTRWSVAGPPPPSMARGCGGSPQARSALPPRPPCELRRGEHEQGAEQPPENASRTATRPGSRLPTTPPIPAIPRTSEAFQRTLP